MESHLLKAENSGSKSKLFQLQSCRSVRGAKKMTELPEDIINEEILTRLPVETLLRFRSVCKSWESLFFTPNFIKAHFNSTINKLDSAYNDCLVTLTTNGFSILSRDKEIRIEPPTPRIEQPKIMSHNGFRLIGSINGLVCLVNRETEFFLWNPIIGRYKYFTLPEKFCQRNVAIDDDCRYLVGFGWDYVENDYQVVACYICRHSRQGAIYSSNSDSWTELVVPNFLILSKIVKSIVSKIELMIPSTIVKECPYWSYTNSPPQMFYKHAGIVKFDIQTREFRVLPELDPALVRGKYFNFVNVKNCLAVLVFEPLIRNNSVEVFLLHEERGVYWNKMYTIGPIQGNVRFWKMLQGFRYGDELIFHDGLQVLSYDPKTKEFKVRVGIICVILSCFTYTASLVSLQGMKPVQGRTI